MIVEEGEPAGPGQITRPAFFALLEASLRTEVDAALQPAGLASHDCPYFERYLDHYRSSPLSHLARAVELYAAPRFASPRGWVDAITRRAVDAAEAWLEGRADPLIGDLSPTGFADLQRTASKAPAMIVRAMGDGDTLDSSFRTRAEEAFGVSLARVRVHADEFSARIAAETQSIAFTVGDHIGLAPGAPQQGSLSGDALLAHEVAHTIQQRPTGGGSEIGAESDADRAAAAMAVGEPARPRWRGPLQLQACSPEGSGYDPSQHAEYHEDPPSAHEMIELYTIGPDLDEDGLGKVLGQMMWYSPVDHSSFVIDVFDLLDPGDRDEVATAMVGEAQESDLLEMASDPAGRRVLQRVWPELTGGWETAGERFAATRAVRALVATSSADAQAERELQALRAAVGEAEPEAAERIVLTDEDVRLRTRLIEARLTEFDQRWRADVPVRRAVRQVWGRIGGIDDHPQRIPLAQDSLDLCFNLLIAIDAEIGRNASTLRREGTENAKAVLYRFVRDRLVEAIGATLSGSGPQKLAEARAALNQLDIAISRVELEVQRTRPTEFGSVRPKLEQLRSFAGWVMGEVESMRTQGEPANARERQALEARVRLLVDSTRVLAHWEVLISMAEALESGFSFTEILYWNDEDIDSIHSRLMGLADLARAGDHAALATAVAAFADDDDIKEFYEDVPSILRSSGIAVAIIVTVVAAAVTWGVGGLLFGGGAGATVGTTAGVGTAAGTSGAAAGAGTSAITAGTIGMGLLKTTVDALVFTSVHRGLATATGLGAQGTFAEEFLWNFGLFGVLRVGGRFVHAGLKARGLARLSTPVTIGGSAGVLEVYGVLRFRIAEGRYPTSSELRRMTGEMLLTLAALVAMHTTVEAMTPIGRFNRAMGGEFRAIEADRAALERDAQGAVENGTLEQLRPEFEQRGRVLEQRTRAWLERATEWSEIPAVREQLASLTEAQQLSQRLLSEAMRMPPEIALQSAGSPSDFSFARGHEGGVITALREQGADVSIDSAAGRPTVIEGRFETGDTLRFAERSTSEPATRPTSEPTGGRQRTTPESERAAEPSAEPTRDEAAGPVEAAPNEAPMENVPEGLYTEAFNEAGEFANAAIEADYQSYLGRRPASEPASQHPTRLQWMGRTGGGPLARLRAELGPGFRPAGRQRHVDRPRLGPVDSPRQIEPFHEPVRSDLRAAEQEIMRLAETDPMQAGNEYQELIANDYHATDVQEWNQRPHRRNDIGGGVGSPEALRGKEVTIEGRDGGFGTGKLDQLWLDMEQTNGISLVVPRLSEAARVQLGRLVRQYELQHPDAPRPTVGVRETLPRRAGTENH